MDRKSTDNITAIVVALGSLGLENNLSDYASVWISFYFKLFYLCKQFTIIIYKNRYNSPSKN